MAREESESGKWLGRRPKGEQDTNSFSAFLKKTPRGQLEEHLARHHKGFSRKAHEG